MDVRYPAVYTFTPMSPIALAAQLFTVMLRSSKPRLFNAMMLSDFFLLLIMLSDVV